MNQPSEEATPLTRSESIKIIAFIAIGFTLLFFSSIFVAHYNTKFLSGVLISGARSAKFFLQIKKKSRTPRYQLISLVLALNWWLLAMTQIVFEIDHQFNIFEPNELLMLQTLLFAIDTLILINESIYDYLRAQMVEKTVDRRWFYWAIGGKAITLLGLSFLFVWLQYGLQKSSPVSIIGVSLGIIGLIVWMIAHAKQPKESDLKIE